MKKLVVCLLIIIVMLSLASCNKNNNVNGEENGKNVQVNNKKDDKNSELNNDVAVLIDKTMDDEAGKEIINKAMGLKNSEYDIIGIAQNYTNATEVKKYYTTLAVISFKEEMLNIIISDLESNYFHIHGSDDSDKPIEWYNYHIIKSDKSSEKLYIKNINRYDERFNPIIGGTESICGSLEYYHQNYYEYPDNEYIATIFYLESRDYTTTRNEYQNEDGQKVLEIQNELSDE